MKPVILFALLMLGQIGLWAQTEPFPIAATASEQSSSAVRFNLVWPGVNAEFAIGKDYSFVGDVSMGGFGQLNDEGLLFSQFSGQFRYYYDFVDRQQENKSISGFSGNYISGGVYYLSLINPESGHLTNLSVMWGSQRTFRNKMYFNFSIGPSIAFVEGNAFVSMWGDLTFGFTIFDR